MKIVNICIVAGMLLCSAALSAQNKQTVRPIKKLRNVKTEEIKVELMKPDNTTLLPRKQSDLYRVSRLNLKRQIQKSNKLLY